MPEALLGTPRCKVSVSLAAPARERVSAQVTLMLENSDTREDLSLPSQTDDDLKLAQQIRDDVAAGKEVTVSVLKAMDDEKIIAAKAT